MKLRSSCQWKPTIICGDVFSTGCGRAFILNDGSLEENGFVFCPFCGRNIIEIKNEEGDQE